MNHPHHHWSFIVMHYPSSSIIHHYYQHQQYCCQLSRNNRNWWTLHLSEFISDHGSWTINPTSPIVPEPSLRPFLKISGEIDLTQQMKGRVQPQTSANWGLMVIERLLNETLMSYISLIFCQTLGNHCIYITSSQAPPCYCCKMHPPLTIHPARHDLSGAWTKSKHRMCWRCVPGWRWRQRGLENRLFDGSPLSFGNAFTPEIKSRYQQLLTHHFEYPCYFRGCTKSSPLMHGFWDGALVRAQIAKIHSLRQHSNTWFAICFCYLLTAAVPRDHHRAQCKTESRVFLMP